jgi:hypothetical protein
MRENGFYWIRFVADNEVVFEIAHYDIEEGWYNWRGQVRDIRDFDWVSNEPIQPPREQ